MLAAEVIYRSTPDVLAIAKEKVLRLVSCWHTPGRVDRAVRFMVMTGQPEFAEHVWQLFSNDSQNVYLAATRVAPRFRPSVLGADAAVKLATLPTKQREGVASEIIMNGGTEGIEFIVAYAKGEADPIVLAEIIEALHFRRADRHVKNLLRGAPDAVWEQLSKRDYGEELAGDEAAMRLADEREKRWKAEPNKQREISALSRRKLDVTALQDLTTAIASPEFDLKSDHAIGTHSPSLQGGTAGSSHRSDAAYRRGSPTPLSLRRVP